MLSRLSGLHINGAASIFVRSIANYCTTAQTAQSHNDALADFLVESLGFSKQAAVSTSSKVSRSRPLQNKPSLVVNYFKNLGFQRTQIRTIVSSDPRLLFYDVDKTLEPKVELFRELGLSGPDLARVLTADQLRAGLDSCIKPRMDYLRQLLLGGDDRVATALKRCYFVLAYDSELVEKNVLVLREYVISDENIARIILWNPRRIFGTTPESLREKLQRVENDLGIPRESPMFIYGFRFLNTHSVESITLKFEILKSYGWSEADILKMVRIFPLSMNMSVDRMRRTLDYYMKELGYTIDYLASHPRLFTFNLERRVKPRNEVLRILNEKKLTKRKTSFYNLLVTPDLTFVQNYVLRYKDELPDMYETYIQKVGLLKINDQYV